MKFPSVISNVATQLYSCAGRLLRRPQLLAITVMGMVPLGACNVFSDPPELAACEEYTRALLKAPATFNRVVAYVSDDKMPTKFWREAYAELAGEQDGSLSELFADIAERRSLAGGVRTVTVQYDAENAMGVPLQSAGSCKFLIASFEDNEFVSEPSASGSLASTYANLGGLEIEAKGCCERNEVLDLISQYSDQSIFVGQREID